MMSHHPIDSNRMEASGRNGAGAAAPRPSNVDVYAVLQHIDEERPPLLPQSLLDNLSQASGMNTGDERCSKLVGLLAEKCVSDILSDAKLCKLQEAAGGADQQHRVTRSRIADIDCALVIDDLKRLSDFSIRPNTGPPDLSRE